MSKHWLVEIDRHRKNFRPRWRVLDTKGHAVLLKSWCHDNGHNYHNLINELKRQLAAGRPEDGLDLHGALRAIEVRKARTRFYDRPSSMVRAAKAGAIKTNRQVAQWAANDPFTPDYSVYPELVPTNQNVQVEHEVTLASEGREARKALYVDCTGGRYSLFDWCKYTGLPYGIVQKRIRRLGVYIPLVLAPPKRASRPQPKQ